MEEARKNFETMVGLAEQKLDDIEKKIDDKFAQHLRSEDEDENIEFEDGATLLKTLEEVKAEYKSLCKEAGELSQAQKQMAKAFQQELLSQVKQLQMLQDKGLIKDVDDESQAAVNRTTAWADGDQSMSQSLNETTQ